MKESGYDAIVIGAGISGLGVSALLAKDGMRVLTLEKGREIGGRAYSFRQRGHITNMGGPRAGLENGRVDALFAELGCEPGERGFFDEVKTFRDGELIDLRGLAMRGDVAQAGKMMHAAREIVESGDLAPYDAMSARQWVDSMVTSPEVIDVARFSAIVMSTLPRLEDISASTLFESLCITMRNPRIYLAAHGYGDFMRILAECSQSCGGEVRTSASASEIVVEDGHVRGVVLGKGKDREAIEAPVVVTAFPIWDLFGLADQGLFPDDFVEKILHLEHKTAIFGITSAVREPVYEGKYFVLTDGPRAGYPISGFMASNIAPQLSPEGEHLFEVCCQCEFELGDDRDRLRTTIEHLKKDLDEIFPGWEENTLWTKSYFHWEEPARNPGRAGVFRPESRAPGVAGLYFTGDTVASRSLPGLECAADSAMMCAAEILS
jgi:phytoene dehydrogenase-like protein